MLVYCTFVRAETSLNAQPSSMRKTLAATLNKAFYKNKKMKLLLFFILIIFSCIRCSQKTKPLSHVYLDSFDRYSNVASDFFYRAKDVKNDSQKHYIIMLNSSINLKTADSFLKLSVVEAIKELPANYGKDSLQLDSMTKKANVLWHNVEEKHKIDSMELSTIKYWLRNH